MILFCVKIIILYLIIIFIFYYIHKNRELKTELKEHFLTYFLPYYNPDIDELYTFYKEDDNKKNYFISKFDYNNYIIAGSLDNSTQISKLTNELLSYTKLYNVVIKKNIKEDTIIKEVNENKIQFGIIPYSSFIYYQQYLDFNTVNCRLISKIYKKYLYILTKHSHQIYSVKDINRNLKLGMEENTNALVIQKIISDIGNSKDIELKLYKSREELEKGLLEDECHVIFLWDAFPSNNIITFTQYNSEIILIPFEFSSLNIFLKKNYYLNNEYVDLNLITSYLPIKFGEYEYNIYRPNMQMLTTYDILITYRDTPKSIVYTIMDFLNKKFQNDVNLYISLDLINILLHEGSKEYLIDNGYISYIDNEICKNFVGIQTCNEKNINI